ncbi:MAG: Gfo/Idh/MocA family oxidoreductase [Bacteroidia bacterium]
MEKRLKWGIIGLGKIANKFAADLRLSETAVLHAVASRSHQKANEFAHKYESVKAYGSYDALVKDPEVDVVYVATPHVFHFEITMMCLEHGKHVLCEKPMGMNAVQVGEMMALAKKKGLFLMEGIWTRFHPSTQKVLELINRGTVGEINHLRADFGFAAAFDPEKRLFNKSLGGGSLLDVGLYPVYLSLQLLGKPQSIAAQARFTQTGVDDFCTMAFDYGNKVKAHLESSLAINTSTEAYIVGTEGAIKLHSRFHECKRISLFKNGEESTFDFEIKGNGYIYEIDEVNRCISQGKAESEKLPLTLSLTLSYTLDLILSEIRLEY